MKFSCERCGKKYATAEQPVPGRLYRLKCKACGHLIAVRGPAEGVAPLVPVARTAADSAVPRGGEASEPAQAFTSGVPLARTTELRLPLPSGSTEELVARAPPPPATARPPPPPEAALAPPPADAGYVDIFADSPDPARAGAPEGPERAAAPEPSPPPADPFLAAARSSLPETFGGPSADPFAPMRAELEAAATGDAARPDGASRPLATPKLPEIPRPPVQKQGLPIALIGAGVLVLVVILGLAVTNVGGKKPPVPAPKVEAAQPVATATLAPEPPPHVELPVAPEGLSQDQIQKVLASTRKAFDGCIASAGKDSSRTLDGRKVALRLNIQPNGTVAYPTLDDENLNALSLGACLKSAAHLMVFPRFKGAPLRIEVPLTLAR